MSRVCVVKKVAVCICGIDGVCLKKITAHMHNTHRMYGAKTSVYLECIYHPQMLYRYIENILLHKEDRGLYINKKRRYENRDS